MIQTKFSPIPSSVTIVGDDVVTTVFSSAPSKFVTLKAIMMPPEAEAALEVTLFPSDLCALDPSSVAIACC